MASAEQADHLAHRIGEPVQARHFDGVEIVALFAGHVVRVAAVPLVVKVIRPEHYGVRPRRDDTNRHLLVVHRCAPQKRRLPATN